MTREHRCFWVVVLSEAEGLRWVLKHSRMAFTAGSAGRAARIRSGDGVVLYVGRGAYHNPTRDESQLTGLAEVVTEVKMFGKPLVIAGREFVCGCDLRLSMALPERCGPPVRPLIGQLTFVRRKDVWGQYFRSGLIEIPERDFRAMAGALDRESAKRAL